MAFFAFLRALLLCAVLLVVKSAGQGTTRGSIRGATTRFIVPRPAVTRFTPANAFTGTYRNPATSTMYRAPLTTTQQVQTGFYQQPVVSQVTTPMISVASCDTNWKNALLAMMTNYDDWKCSSRTYDTGEQACVLTGPMVSGVQNTFVYSGCGWILPYFCDDSVRDLVNSMIGTQQAPAAPVPAGYTQIVGTGYYKVHPEPLPWSQAKAACEAEGTHLATPVSGNDYSVLWSFVASQLSATQLTNGLWYGFSDLAYDGDFRTVAGQPTCMFGALPFATGQPDGGTAENCLQFGMNSDPTFNDLACTEALPFVCEQTLSTRSTVCRQVTYG